MKLKAVTTALVAAGIGLGIAGCGSSTAPGVVLAPGGGPTVEAATTPSTTTTATTDTTTVATPKAGPLSKEPKVSIPSGPPPKKLEIKDLIKGTGTTVKKGTEINLNYVGELYSNGKVFDSSWKDSPGKTYGPVEAGAGAFIPGFDQGLIGMKVGGRRELIIPPSLGYGKKGDPPAIPKNATLVFVVDLVSAK